MHQTYEQKEKQTTSIQNVKRIELWLRNNFRKNIKETSHAVVLTLMLSQNFGFAFPSSHHRRLSSCLPPSSSLNGWQKLNSYIHKANFIHHCTRSFHRLNADIDRRCIKVLQHNVVAQFHNYSNDDYFPLIVVVVIHIFRIWIYVWMFVCVCVCTLWILRFNGIIGFYGFLCIRTDRRI